MSNTLNIITENHGALFEYYSSNNNSDELEKIRRLLNLAIQNELNDRQRLFITHYYFDNWSLTKIANKYGINRATVSRYLKRARQKMGVALKYSMMNISE